LPPSKALDPALNVVDVHEIALDMLVGGDQGLAVRAGGGDLGDRLRGEIG
jgi:hypothetical protein